MRVLELFKGTGSVSKIFEPAGHKVVSLDIIESFNPTHCCDILDFDYKQYPPGYFKLIWASPECKVYSNLQTTNVGPNRAYKTRAALDKVRKDNSKYVERVLEIIDYFQPKEWYIENPWTSAMKDLPCMKDLKSYRFDYCRFGFKYKKPTRIWTNREDMEDHKCTCKIDIPGFTVHEFQIGITTPSRVRGVQDVTNTLDRYRIPEGLLRYMFAKHLKRPRPQSAPSK